MLLISADLDELIGLSDTLKVILRGRLVGRRGPRRRHARGARLGDDRRRRVRRHERPLRPPPKVAASALAAPVLAHVVFALVITSRGAARLAASDPLHVFRRD